MIFILSHGLEIIHKESSYASPNSHFIRNLSVNRFKHDVFLNISFAEKLLALNQEWVKNSLQLFVESTHYLVLQKRLSWLWDYLNRVDKNRQVLIELNSELICGKHYLFARNGFPFLVFSHNSVQYWSLGKSTWLC